MTLDVLDESWRRDFILASEAHNAGEREMLAASARRGELVRIRRGVYLQPSALGGFPETRHAALVRAQHLVADRGLLFSHRSAAALWCIPRLDPWPDEAEVLVPASSGGRAEGGLRRRTSGVPAEVDRLGGIMVTSFTRTLVDLARVDSAASAVASLDAGLAGIPTTAGSFTTSKEALYAELESMHALRGTRAAARAIGFANPASGSPGESLSRVQIDRLGLTAPELQHEFVDEEGSMFADFYWPEFGVAGEFDGHGKYLRYAADPGESTRKAVMAEKRREDRIRRLGPTVARWDWTIARNRPLLGEILRDAGVR